MVTQFYLKALLVEMVTKLDLAPAKELFSQLLMNLTTFEFLLIAQFNLCLKSHI